jgi:RimJ/RimL family protein N-acetyltransferase
MSGPSSEYWEGIMKELETERLILRAFREEDFAAVHAYASTVENTVYMPFGPNSEQDTRDFIARAVAWRADEPCRHYEFAVTLRENGALIGGCGLHYKADDCAEIGWILHRSFWRRGYGTELGHVLLAFGFCEMGLRRVVSRCDAENVASYGVMEKLGMRREGLLLEAIPTHKLSDRRYGDELLYAILREEWEAQREIAYYNGLPCEFNGFIDVPSLSDGGISLVCTQKNPADPERKLVPWYDFAICRGGEQIGRISLRVGYADRLYYGGQVGYAVDEAYRGRGYAAAACRLLMPVARAHGMKKLLITNDPSNGASRRVCEKLGARFVRCARLPEWTDQYRKGRRFTNIFEFEVT